MLKDGSASSNPIVDIISEPKDKEKRPRCRYKKRKKNTTLIDCDQCSRKWLMFFSKWTYIGIIFILVALLGKQALVNKTVVQSIFLYNLLEIMLNLFSTIGIALLIGAIFDFSKNSNSFMKFISNILSEVVISKTFLQQLNNVDKRKALELILQPTGDQISQHTSINAYFQKRISESMSIFNTNFKTNLVLSLEARKNNGKVEIRGTLSNRIYKIENKYKPILTIFERSNSSLSNTRIITPDGVSYIDQNMISIKEEDEAGIKYKHFSFDIPEAYYKYPYLTIQKDVFEEGYDHWTNFHWTSLTPCDGIDFTLVCCNDLEIKEHVVFDRKDSYVVTKSADSKRISIISTSWLNAFTGFTMTIGEVVPN